MKLAYQRISLVFYIGIFTLMLSACSPAVYEVHVVEKIAVSNQVLYVQASEDCNYCENVGGYVYFASNDNGETWREVASPSVEIIQILERNQNNKSPICLSDDPQICYRITDTERVEFSVDGGVSWQVDWQIPVGRKYYMQRHSLYFSPDTNPRDIKIIESGGGYFVAVAMGNQGVLVKTSNGEWNRYAVGKASPTPYQSASFSEATDVLFNEWIVAILIAIGFFLFLSVSTWVSAYANSDPVLGRRVLIACLPFVLSVSIFILYYLVAVSNLFRPRFFGEMQTIIIFSPLIGFVITWLAVILVSRNKGFGFLALILGVIFSIILYLCILFPFQLWALGTIAVYETSQGLVWLVGVIVFLVSVMTEIKIAVLAVKQTDN